MYLSDADIAKRALDRAEELKNMRSKMHKRIKGAVALLFVSTVLITAILSINHLLKNSSLVGIEDNIVPLSDYSGEDQ